LYFVDTYCDDPPGTALTDSICTVGGSAKIRLGQLVHRASGRTEAALLVSKDFTPSFMRAGPEKDRILGMVATTILDEIREMGWEAHYAGGEVEVDVADFENYPEIVTVVYYHPPWGRMQRELFLDPDGERYHFYRSMKYGYSPNASFTILERDLSEHFLARLREHVVRLKLRLDKPESPRLPPGSSGKSPSGGN
jgi:hypothetical protein